MRTLRSSILVLILTLVAWQPAAASQSTPDGSAPLANSTWQLQAEDGESAAEPHSSVTFLADGVLQVTTACPAVEGTYTATNEGDLTINLPSEVIAGCDDASANALFAALAAASGFAVDDFDALAITGANGEVTTFSPVLAGITWQWVEFQSSDGSLVTPDPVDLHTMLIHPDGTVEINTPCAGGSGTGTFEGRTGFDVDLSGLDVSACPEDSPAALLMRDVDFATSYVIRNGHLYVALPMDGGIHEFAPVYEP